MINKILTFALLVFVFTSCTVEDLYIEESVFIPDPEIPGLPIYSEMGYNTFGVRYERELITQKSGSYPLKIFVKNNVTSFVFTGRSDWLHDYEITIKMSDYLPEDIDDLLDLNQTTYDLKAKSIEVDLEYNNSSKDIEIISGEFEVKKAQRLKVDGEEKGIILSGVFQFKAYVDDVPVAFSLGRYDVLLGYSNFFVLD